MTNHTETEQAEQSAWIQSLIATAQASKPAPVAMTNHTETEQAEQSAWIQSLIATAHSSKHLALT